VNPLDVGEFGDRQAALAGGELGGAAPVTGVPRGPLRGLLLGRHGRLACGKVAAVPTDRAVAHLADPVHPVEQVGVEVVQAEPAQRRADLVRGWPTSNSRTVRPVCRANSWRRCPTSPAVRTVPSLGASSPAIRRSSVDFPLLLAAITPVRPGPMTPLSPVEEGTAIGPGKEDGEMLRHET
jgi:hypothetical protein